MERFSASSVNVNYKGDLEKLCVLTDENNVWHSRDGKIDISDWPFLIEATATEIINANTLQWNYE